MKKRGLLYRWFTLLILEELVISGCRCCVKENVSGLPFLQRQELPPHGLRVAAGLAQPQQWVQDGVDGAPVQAAQFQAPVWDFPEFDQSILGADLVLAVVEVTLDGGKVKPVHLLSLRGNLNLKKRGWKIESWFITVKFSYKSGQSGENPTWSMTSFLADRHNIWAITLYRGSVFPRR